MRGRKPQPALTGLTKVRPGGGRQRHVHVMSPLLDPGAELAGPERKLFQEIAQNAVYGLLTVIDKPMLTVFVQHFVLHQRALADLRTLPELTVKTRTTTRAHPLESIVNEQAKLLVLLAESLGLSATARQRIKLPQPPAPGSNWADLPLGS